MRSPNADQTNAIHQVQPQGALTVPGGDQGLSAVDTIDQEKLRDAWIAWLEGELAKGEITDSTLRAYKANIGYWFKYLGESARLARPTPLTISEYAAAMRKGREPATAQTYLYAVKSFYGWCEANGLYPAIGRSIKMRTNRRDGPLPALTHEEVVELIAGIPESTLRRIRDRALISLIYATALRTISIVRLDVEDVDLANNSLRHRGKGRQAKDTLALFAPSVGALLGRYLDARAREVGLRAKEAPLTSLAPEIRDEAAAEVAGPPEDVRSVEKAEEERDDDAKGNPLFIALDRNSWGNRLTAKSIRAIVLENMELAGHARRENGKLVNPGVFAAHSLRRSAAVTTADAGGIELAQGLLGHASADTTKKAYARVKLHRDLQKNAHRLDPLS